MSNEQRPLFSVGERVKLVSKSYPECNGEYIVEKVLERGDEFACRISGIACRMSAASSGNYSYLLDIPHKRNYETEESTWAESSLRKIYDTGEYSFDELMNVLKSPITDNIQ